MILDLNTLTAINKMSFFRSISGEEKDEKIDKTKTAKIAERLAKKREKLLSMKRCSGYLKRPEILETVYSVEVSLHSHWMIYLVANIKFQMWKGIDQRN